MRRYYLITTNDVIEAEGALFDSGIAVTSFLDPVTSGAAVWPSIDRARAIHVRVGGRRLAWEDGEAPDDAPIAESQYVQYPDGLQTYVHIETGT